MIYLRLDIWSEHQLKSYTLNPGLFQIGFKFIFLADINSVVNYYMIDQIIGAYMSNVNACVRCQSQNVDYISLWQLLSPWCRIFPDLLSSLMCYFILI